MCNSFSFSRFFSLWWLLILKTKLARNSWKEIGDFTSRDGVQFRWGINFFRGSAYWDTVLTMKTLWNYRQYADAFVNPLQCFLNDCIKWKTRMIDHVCCKTRFTMEANSQRKQNFFDSSLNVWPHAMFDFYPVFRMLSTNKHWQNELYFIFCVRLQWKSPYMEIIIFWTLFPTILKFVLCLYHGRFSSKKISF